MQKKVLLILCLCSLMINPVQAEENKSLYEMTLEDIIYIFLSPLESKAIEEYFGEIYLSDFCRLVKVRTNPDTAYRYEITYQFITYERVIMPPYHLFTLKVKKNSPTDWVINDVQVRKLSENEDYTKMCRKPIKDSRKILN